MRRVALFALALLALLGASSSLLAQSRAVAPDPYALDETRNINPIFPPSRDVGTKTLGTQTINTGVQNCIIIAAGQSNMANTAPTPYTPTNGTSLDFLNVYDGAIYKATDPLIGASNATTPPPGGAHPILRLADALVSAAKCARVIIVPIGLNSSAIADWATGGLTQRIPIAILRIKQRGITCGATNITCVIIWGQGESDGVTSQATYTTAFNTMVANAAAAGFSGRWLVNKETFDTVFTPAVQAAQAAVVNGTSIFAGANADALVGNVCNGSNACRQVDGLHWSDNGSQALATDATNGLMAALHASGAPF